ncbi:sigma-70 family RNA polymerase sigma factor [Sinorhizobium medicae]|uniref:RNA polymerase sigma factor n=1 Tax=Sinorhizobium medicae TaxID=110321 RepID=UPI002AF6CA7C|nr:sigma-70 family RNA polymerase sigma factor [Sinorhizobium medicae]WQO73024.1 sigma-70 family RNA polymerase sigma factor [Sinorhizobium medicae]
MTGHLTSAHYSDLLRFARRQTRRAADAEDLLQEALIVALRARRLPVGENRAWFRGVIRNLATMQARTAARRIPREQQMPLPDSEDDVAVSDVLAFAATLTPRLRIVMLLAIAGHNRPEIRHLLRISDEALRQRILMLRRAWRDADRADARSGNDRPELPAGERPDPSGAAADDARQPRRVCQPRSGRPSLRD